jgi:hypothetical protein
MHLTKEQGTLTVAAAVLMAFGGAHAAAAARSAPRPHPHGRLRLRGALRDGAELVATGVRFTPVPGSLQSVSYAFSACTRRRCVALSIPPHQPYLPSALLGPGDVGKRIRVAVKAVDVLRDGNERSATVWFRSARRVSPWPREEAPRIDFVYGLPQPVTASARERFDFVAHSSPADGKLTVSCSLDSRRFSPACAGSRSYLTPILRPGRHTVRLRVADRAGARTASYSWRVVALPSPRPCSSCALPRRLDATGHPMSWDWQLQGGLVFRRVDMFDIDGLQNSASVVARIHSRAGRTRAHELAVCYLSLGSWERYRPDEASWPRAALGLTLAGYPDEHWVDVRQLRALTPIIDARLRMCARKGFDGVEVDNIDGWDNRSGFPLTPQDAEAWLAQIANQAHALGMFALWKNDPYLASFGLRYFDGALSEQCFSYRECSASQNAGIRFFSGMRCNTTSLKCGVAQFAAAGKWVGEVEYKWGVEGEDGAVCDPGQRCRLRKRHGNYVEVPYATFCRAVYRLPAGGFGFAAVRKYESDALNRRETFGCWGNR